MPVSVYIHPQVRKVIDLYEQVIDHLPEVPVLVDRLHLFSDRLWKAVEEGDTRFQIEFSNHFPAWNTARVPSREDTYLVTARSFGFSDWDAVPASREEKVDLNFERAVDLMLNGDLDNLSALLQANPSLIQQHSAYGHRAGLIHYLAANGVEIWRQKVPANAVEIIRVLQSFGADVKQTSNIYGANHSLKALIETSAHPSAAGLKSELLAALS